MTAATLRPVAVREPAPVSSRVRRRRGLGSWLLFVAIVVAAFYGLIFSRISLDRSAFELDELQRQINAEESRHFELRVEVAELMDPNRIATAAARLGMVYPTERNELTTDVMRQPGVQQELRWAQLRTLLSAQP